MVLTAPQQARRRQTQTTTTVVYRPGFDAEARGVAGAAGLDPAAAQVGKVSVLGPGDPDVGTFVGSDQSGRP